MRSVEAKIKVQGNRQSKTGRDREREGKREREREGEREGERERGKCV